MGSCENHQREFTRENKYLLLRNFGVGNLKLFPEGDYCENGVGYIWIISIREPRWKKRWKKRWEIKRIDNDEDAYRKRWDSWIQPRTPENFGVPSAKPFYPYPLIDDLQRRWIRKNSERKKPKNERKKSKTSKPWLTKSQKNRLVKCAMVL